jgi:DNA-binding MarR family transcriptional regulator
MSDDYSLMDVLFPSTRQKVLSVLLLQPDAVFHLRELARQTNCHAGTLARELDKLTQAGLLLRTEQSNHVRYQAHKRHLLFDELAALFRKTHGMLPALRDLLAPLDAQISLSLVFGAAARGTYAAGTSLDLLVLGDVGFAELMQTLHKAQRRDVKPVLYRAQEFAARARHGDAFARDLLSKPQLFVKGGAHDLAALINEPP